MNLPTIGRLRSFNYPPILFGMALWGLMWLMLWVSLDVGISKLGFLGSMYEEVRPVFPYAATGLGTFIILAKVWWRRPLGTFFLSPLGLAALYGLVGFVAAFLSPNGSVALYWAAAYLAVPMVLWAIVLGNNAPDRLQLIIRLNQLIVLLLVTGLFAAAIVELNLGGTLLHPRGLVECQSAANKWFGLTSGALRDSGVGRYAAIAAIMGLAGLWHRSWRLLWSSVLMGSLILLLFSQTRGAMVSFVAAASLMVALSLSRKTLLLVLASLAILIPVVWLTGAPRSFVDNCFLGSYGKVAKLRKELSQPAPAATNTPEQDQDLEAGQTQELGRLEVPAGKWALVQVPPNGQGSSMAASLLQIPDGQWVLELDISPNSAPAEEPQRLNLSSGLWALEEVALEEVALEEVALEEVPLEEANASKAAMAENGPVSPPKVVDDGALILEQDAGGPSIEEANASTVALTREVTTDMAGNGPASPPKVADDGALIPEQDADGPSTRLVVATGVYVLKPWLDTSSEVVQPPGSVAEASAVQPPGSVAEASAVQPPGSVAEASAAPAPSQKPEVSRLPILGVLPKGFYTFSGRTVAWEAGWEKIKESPLLGHGFHADRLLLGTHMHNSFLHALLQTGIIGAIPFLGALLFGWVLLCKAVWHLRHVSAENKHQVILTAGMLAFLTLRSIPESTGAFFGVDWLLLAPLLLHLYILNRPQQGRELSS